MDFLVVREDDVVSRGVELASLDPLLFKVVKFGFLRFFTVFKPLWLVLLRKFDHELAEAFQAVQRILVLINFTLDLLNLVVELLQSFVFLVALFLALFVDFLSLCHV